MRIIKQQRHTLDYFEKIVAGLVILVIAVLAGGCGFQLNRNKLDLPNEARSIAISGIENQSFVPRLDIRLKALLIDTFNSNAVPLKTANQADLVLKVMIKTYEEKQNEYSLDESGQTYEFHFTITGTMSVFDNRLDTFYIHQDPLKGSYSVTTQAADLSSTELDEAREKLLDALSDAIADKLTDSF